LNYGAACEVWIRTDTAIACCGTFIIIHAPRQEVTPAVISVIRQGLYGHPVYFVDLLGMKYFSNYFVSSTVLPDKLIVAELVKKKSTLLMQPKG
jgi:hypothetical protein